MDGKYAFSLSETALLEQKLASKQELTAGQVQEFKRLSGDDKLYGQTLRWATMRLRSEWEVETYLQRKKASPALVSIILNKLSKIGLIDDEKLAEVFVADRRLLRPTSRRKLILELRKKHVEEDAMKKALDKFESGDERAALKEIISQKRRQTKYQDDLKLMQYLARQGFNYGDIKTALERKKG